MSNEGIQLKVKDSAFKIDLLHLIGSALKASLKLFVLFKTGGALLEGAPMALSGFWGTISSIKREKTNELRAWILVSGGLVYSLERVIKDIVPIPDKASDRIGELVDALAVRVESRVYTIRPEFFRARKV